MQDLFNQLGEILKPEPSILQHLEGKAIGAHRNTSFSPERRGTQMIKEYSEELENDMQELREGGADEETIADYKNRYERFFTSYLHAKSNCFSVMITGAGNFPVRRHEKANRSEEKHYEIFREWRIRAKKAIVRKAQPAKTFLSEIDRYKSELESMKKNHALIIGANKMISKARKSGEDISEYLINIMGVPAHMVSHTMTWGFGTQNNNANMKRVEARIKEMEVKEGMKNEQPITEYSFEGGKMIVNYEIDRIQIQFDSKPSYDELKAWKEKGLSSYNWSLSANAWQRKITANAMYSVKRLLPPLTKVIS